MIRALKSFHKPQLCCKLFFSPCQCGTVVYDWRGCSLDKLMSLSDITDIAVNLPSRLQIYKEWVNSVLCESGLQIQTLSDLISSDSVLSHLYSSLTDDWVSSHQSAFTLLVTLTLHFAFIAPDRVCCCQCLTLQHQLKTHLISERVISYMYMRNLSHHSQRLVSR